MTILIKILAVGNSFSQDATHYLHQIAAADKVDMKVGNLYIGNCSLERHWNNIQNDAQEYLYEENGYSTEKYISVRQALNMDKWDYIVTQQVSYDSGIIETYFPYIELIKDYIKKQEPQSEFLLQETWAYEIDSLHFKFNNYNQNQQEMYEKLSKTYKNVAEKIGVRLIPCGDAVQALRKKDPFVYANGGMSLCRDGFHMNIIYGRYLLAAVWYKTLVGNSVSDNAYIPSTKLAPNAVCNERILKVVKNTVDEII